MKVADYIRQEQYNKNVYIYWDHLRYLWLVIPFCLVLCISIYGIPGAIGVFIFWFLSARTNSNERRQRILRQLEDNNPVTALYVHADRDEVPNVRMSEVRSEIQAAERILDRMYNEGKITDEDREGCTGALLYYLAPFITKGKELYCGRYPARIPVTEEVKEQWDNRTKPADFTPEIVRKISARYWLNIAKLEREKILERTRESDFEKWTRSHERRGYKLHTKPDENDIMYTVFKADVNKDKKIAKVNGWNAEDLAEVEEKIKFYEAACQ